MTVHASQGSTPNQPAHQESTHQPNPAPTGPPPRGLNPLQREYLLKPLDAGRVRQVQGMNHLEAWDIRRTLTRLFGFGGWQLDTLALDLIDQRETDTPRPRHTVAYRAQVRLTIRDPHGNTLTHFEDAAVGDAVNQPSLGDAHDLAVKSALSGAMKRCAVSLGDQFGLSLYDGGGRLDEDTKGRKIMQPVVQATLDTHRGKAPTVRDQPVQGESGEHIAA